MLNKIRRLRIGAVRVRSAFLATLVALFLTACAGQERMVGENPTFSPESNYCLDDMYCGGYLDYSSNYWTCDGEPVEVKKRPCAR